MSDIINSIVKESIGLDFLGSDINSVNVTPAQLRQLINGVVEACAATVIVRKSKLEEQLIKYRLPAKRDSYYFFTQGAVKVMSRTAKDIRALKVSD